MKKLCTLFMLFFALSAHSANAEPIKVVASFSVIADMVKQVGGDAVDVYSLVAPGVDAHTFRPTPKSVVKVKRADVLVMNGLGFETWMPRVLDAAHFKGQTVVLGDVIDAIEVSELEAHHHHHGEGHHDDHGDHHDHKAYDHESHHDHDEAEHSGHHEDEHEAHADHQRYYDPHAWQDVSQAVQYVDAIAHALAQQRPKKAESIQARARAYKSELMAIDRAFRARIKTVPSVVKKVVTDHNAFTYLSRAYGIQFYAVRGLSTEAGASAKDVSRVIRTMQAKHVKLVYLEAMTNTKLAKQIAKESNVKVAGQLYTGVLAPSGQASTYLGMMTHNLDVLAKGLESLK